MGPTRTHALRVASSLYTRPLSCFHTYTCVPFPPPLPTRSPSPTRIHLRRAGPAVVTKVHPHPQLRACVLTPGAPY